MADGNEDDVFTKEPAAVKHSGSGRIAALISETKQTGQLKDISKKDRAIGHLQRILSVPDHFTRPIDGTKKNYRSISVSPSNRNAKCSSVVILSRSKSPEDQISPLSQSSGISSIDMDDTPIFEDTHLNQSSAKGAGSEPSKPVPKPRGKQVDNSSSSGLPAEDLEYENGILRKQISCLKEQQSELEIENRVLRDHLNKVDSPVVGASNPKLKSGACKPAPTPRVNRSKTVSESEQKPETPQSPVPKPRSNSKEKDERDNTMKTLEALPPTGDNKKKNEPRDSDGLTRTERSLLQMQELMKENTTTDNETHSTTGSNNTAVTSKPTPKVRNIESESSPRKESTHPPSNSRPSASKPSKPPAASISVNTNKFSETKNVELEDKGPVPPCDTKLTRPSPPRDSKPVTKSPSGDSKPVTRPSPPGDSKPVTRPSPPGDSKPVTKPSPPGDSKPVTKPSPPGDSKPVTRPSPPRDSKPVTKSPPRDSKPVTRSSPPGDSKPVTKSPPRESKPVTRSSPPGDSKPVTKPSPPGDSKPVTRSSPPGDSKPVTKLSPSQGSNSTTHSDEATRLYATQGTPSTGGVTTTDNQNRDSQTPKEPAKTTALPPRPPPPTQSSWKPKQRKTQIKEDASWILNKDSMESYDARSTISPSSSVPVLNTSPTPARKYHPYRSHAIISTSGPTNEPVQPSRPLTPEPRRPPQISEVSVNSDLSNSSVASDSKLPGSKGKNRFRSGTVFKTSKGSQNIPSRRRSNSFTRSSSVRGTSSKSKDEPESRDQPPPKKPPRLRIAKSPSNSRPISMIEASPNEKTEAEFTSSCTIGTLPREGDKSPNSSRSAMEPKEKKRFLGRFRNRTQYKNETPTVSEEPDEEAESSSDDEKGGTIRRMPRLRHVRPKSVDVDDGEPEYHQLFEYVFVVELKDKGRGQLDTKVTYTFPPAPEQVFSGKDAALLSIPQFCFPDIDQWKPTKSYNSESFSFVLTDMEGGRRFGYCRRLLPSGTGPRLPEVFCIVSPLGCFSLYEKILDEVEERRAVSSSAVFTFLKAIQANPFPRPGKSVEVRAFGAHGTGLETVVLTRPMDSRLEHVDFSLLFSTLSARKIIQLFSSLLLERRVILCAHSLSLLSGCAHALLALLYPFEWQHVFIPVLPNNLIDFVCSPLPYIIGINPSLIKQLDTMEMEEALVIDLEKKKFVMKIGDEQSILPTKLFQYLEHSLGSSVIATEYLKKGASSTGRADEIVVNTFMTFFAYLYNDYKAHMKVVNASTREKQFQRAQFIKTFSSKSTRRFLEAFQLTQLFENFIEQRENPAKEETTAQSHFEQQLSVLQPRCQEIEIFSSKSRFDRWKLTKGMKKFK